MNFKILALLPLLALPFSGLAHEGHEAMSPTAKTKHTSMAKTKKAKAAKHEHWVCPMHDGGESDHAGKCKKCGMDLVKEAK